MELADRITSMADDYFGRCGESDVWRMKFRAVADELRTAASVVGEETDGWKHWSILERAICTAIDAGTIRLEDGKIVANPGAEARDAARMDFIASEYLHLIPFEMPTGAGDADVGWVVSQSSMTGDIEIARHYADDPRAAIDAAVRAREVGGG